MSKNPDLYDIADVCAYFNLSESSIRRKVRDSRDGIGNFPLPLFKSRCRVLWKKSDIEAWRGEDAETITFTAPPIPSIPQAPSIPSSAEVRRGLEAFGFKFGNE